MQNQIQTTNPLTDAALLQEMLNTHLEQARAASSAKRRKRSKPYVYPSMIGRCTRQQVYKMCGYEEPVSPKLARIFDNGNDMHERYQAYFMKMGLLKPEDAEVPFRSDEYRVSGRIDGILRSPEGQWASILELKSANKRSFDNMNKYGPLKEHVIQVMLYMALTPIKEAIIFVECKDNQDTSIYPVTYSENEGEKVLQRVMMLTECADAKRLPPREFRSDSYECRWCYYKDMCSKNMI